jgi:hypothetical protein
MPSNTLINNSLFVINMLKGYIKNQILFISFYLYKNRKKFLQSSVFGVAPETVHDC